MAYFPYVTFVKTLYDIKVFKEYLDACDEKREIEDITPVELQEIIKKFVLAVRKKNGLSKHRFDVCVKEIAIIIIIH